MKLALICVLMPTILHSTYCEGDALTKVVEVAKQACLKAAPVSSDALQKIFTQEVQKDDAFSKYIQCMSMYLGWQTATGGFNLHLIKNATATILGSRQLDSVIDNCTRFVVENPPSESSNIWWELFQCFRTYVDHDLFLQVSEKWLHLHT